MLLLLSLTDHKALSYDMYSWRITQFYPSPTCASIDGNACIVESMKAGCIPWETTWTHSCSSRMTLFYVTLINYWACTTG